MRNFFKECKYIEEKDSIERQYQTVLDSIENLASFSDNSNEEQIKAIKLMFLKNSF